MMRAHISSIGDVWYPWDASLGYDEQLCQTSCPRSYTQFCWSAKGAKRQTGDLSPCYSLHLLELGTSKFDHDGREAQKVAVPEDLPRDDLDDVVHIPGHVAVVRHLVSARPRIQRLF
eukprot:6203052-Pleurochrysis_carterae.AAC.1